ncbi:MAG: TlpA disulfide reductase family protein [Halieaceae bacterium]|jgi:thiol-disulfide isomerase/thioredoxin|nr:TlpA disulfide reductase family protein [Halieaceae bacterium]
MSETPKTQPSVSRRALGWVRDLAIFALLMWAVLWYQSKDMLDTSGEVTIQAFTLPTLAGETAVIQPDSARPTLVYFFAPWCSVCRNTISHLETVDTAQTQVIVIALDWASKEDVEAFVADTGLSFPVHLGTTEIRDRFQVQAYPSYYVLDPAFRVVDKAMGYLTVLDLKLREI